MRKDETLRFEHTHDVNGSEATSSHVKLRAWENWNLVILRAPYLSTVSFTNEEATTRCRNVIQQHARADRADRVIQIGHLTMKFESWSLDEYVNILRVAEVHHDSQALKQHIIDEIQRSVMRDRHTCFQNIMTVRSLIPSLPLDRDQNVFVEDPEGVRAICNGLSYRLPLISATGIARFRSHVPAVRWDKLYPVLDRCQEPVQVLEG